MNRLAQIRAYYPSTDPWLKRGARCRYRSGYPNANWPFEGSNCRVTGTPRHGGMYVNVRFDDFEPNTSYSVHPLDLEPTDDYLATL
jgi:hypothetical protein